MAQVLVVTWKQEFANMVFAGPVSGVSGTPGFRKLVLADLPSGIVGSGGGGTSYAPLTNGSKDSPELIFADGDCIMIPFA